ncbi:MAG: cytochrome P450 [Lentinula lateritia]|nr:MAG: cytochrome P450 [Lentinula lateritia]
MFQSFYGEAHLIHKIVFGAGFFLLLVIIVVRNRAHRLPLPPGPKGYPLIGNALSLPSERPWLTYCQWSKRFGDVIHLSALGQSIIILNSARSIYDLLERRSALYSDRPSTVMAGELVGYGDSPAFISNGPRHRTFRRLFSEVLIPRRVEEWRPLQEQKIQILVRGLTEAPTAFRAHIRRYIASLVFEISHGHIVEGDDDDFIRMAKQVDDDISVLMVPGNFLVDFFSFLRYIPDWTGVPFKKKAKIFKQTLQNALNRPYQQVKEQIAAGNALPSFAASLIERKENPTEEDTAIFKWASFVFYTAGADTSVSVLSSFILAMAVNPTKQRKAQAEIDRVIGSGRRPAFKDRLDLPYVESILKEVYRLNPVTPIAIPHNLNPTSDDEYRGWRIPKESVVIANSWAVLHDAELYPSPFEFLPERYHRQEHQVHQSSSGPTYDGTKVNPDPRKFVFGYGRRVCPGQLLADDTVFISIVTILALFDIGPLTSGEEPKYTPHLISHPEEFTCDIRPRSKVVQNLQV